MDVCEWTNEWMNEWTNELQITVKEGEESKHQMLTKQQHDCLLSIMAYRERDISTVNIKVQIQLLRTLQFEKLWHRIVSFGL